MICKEKKLHFIIFVSVLDFKMKKFLSISQIFKTEEFFISILVYVYTTLFVYLLLPTIPLIIDFITSSNHSQKRNFLFELDYGMDKQQYFYYISIHSYIGTAIVANLIASCDTMYMLYAQHAYALFAIVR